jgi:hypothetical protein
LAIDHLDPTQWELFLQKEHSDEDYTQEELEAMTSQFVATSNKAQDV